MGRTPFRGFDGYLKQHAQESLSDTEQGLFELLFPTFEGTSAAQDAYQESIKHPLASLLAPLIEIAPGERRPRRYAGFDLPRRRYSAVCRDASGDDAQTLAHELRAYRNPVDLGMVEVLDLASGAQLQIQDVTVPLAAQPAVAVLIHEPERLPQRFRALKFQQAPGLKKSPLFIYKFPYRVSHTRVKRTIDLRFPDVQEWFYRTFRELPDTIKQGSGGLGSSPTIAHSQFHLDNGVPPMPDSFWSMLPTLMNPDIGGGNPADTGSTLLAIGHWMRQNEADALVYPSARCDAAAVMQKSDLKNWQGWNLVDYRDSPLAHGRAHVSTFVLSPWAWDRLPPGVRLHVAESGSPFGGSFAVEKMVDYWSEDYRGQLKALEIARSIHGRESQADRPGDLPEGLACRAFQIGSLSIKWLRMMVEGAPAEQIESTVLELQGLALPYGLYSITGRALELWSEFRNGSTSVDGVIEALLITNSMVFQFLGDRYPGEDLDKLATIGADLELLLFFLTLRVKAGNKVGSASLDVSGFLGETGAALATKWVDDGLKGQVAEFHKAALREVNSATGNAASCLAEGVLLQRAIYDRARAAGGSARFVDRD